MGRPILISFFVLTLSGVLGSGSSAQDPSASSTLLDIGVETGFELTEAAVPITTDTLASEKYSYLQPVLSEALRIRVPRDGHYLLEMRSFVFDAYLILTDEKGFILAENDDGPTWRHARIGVNNLRKNEVYLVHPCALGGKVGAFWLELNFRSARAPLKDTRSPRQKIRDEIAQIERGVSIVGKEDDPDARGALALLCEEMGILFGDLKEFAESERWFRRAHELHCAAPNPDRLIRGRVALRLGRALTGQKRPEEAIPLLEEAAHCLADPDRGEWKAEALFHLGSSLFATRRFQASMNAFEEALATDELDSGDFKDTLRFLVRIDRQRGDVEGGIRHAARLAESLDGYSEWALERAAKSFPQLCEWLRPAPDDELGEGVEDLASFSRDLDKIGGFLYSVSQCDPALAFAESGLDLTRRLGRPALEISQKSRALAKILVAAKQFDRARSHLEASIQQVTKDKPSARGEIGLLHLAVCRVALAAGDANTALSACLEAQPHLDAAFGPRSEEAAFGLAARSRVKIAQNDLEEAEILARKALALRGETSSSGLHGASDTASRKDLSLAEARHCLGSLFKIRNRGSDVVAARDLLDRSFKTRRRSLGPLHPETMETRRLLDAVGGEKSGPIVLGVGVPPPQKRTRLDHID